MTSTVSGTAILLRQYFFTLRLLEQGPYVIRSLESVKNLLSSVESARECPLVRVKMMPGRLDGVFYCRALGQQRSPRGKAAVDSRTNFSNVN